MNADLRRDVDRIIKESTVHLACKGLGGRSQELVLAAAPGIMGISGAAVFSVGSDGTDGPTDAAGGYADSDTAAELNAMGLSVAALSAALVPLSN
jgi:hydroxypyruvate reductase